MALIRYLLFVFFCVDYLVTKNGARLRLIENIVFTGLQMLYQPPQALPLALFHRALMM